MSAPFSMRSTALQRNSSGVPYCTQVIPVPMKWLGAILRASSTWLSHMVKKVDAGIDAGLDFGRVLRAGHDPTKEEAKQSMNGPARRAPTAC